MGDITNLRTKQNLTRDQGREDAEAGESEQGSARGREEVSRFSGDSRFVMILFLMQDII